jgi:oxygen-dependent protoporphyrinogen oxidase
MAPPKRILVLGAGISGLSTAYFLRQRRPEVEVVVVDPEATVGGTARSERVDGYTFDWGPNGFLTGSGHALTLAQRLGLGMTEASPQAKKRYLYTRGALRPVPSSPPALLKSDLLSAGGKLRLLGEPLVGRVSHEETVYDFAARRLGEEAARNLVRPAVVGIGAGDARELSVQAMFPAIAQLEAEHGGLVKGMVARMRQAKKEGKKGGLGALASFGARGIQALPDALAQALEGCLRLGSGAKAMEPRPVGGWSVWLEDGAELVADAVVLATPAYVSARLLAPFLPEAARKLDAIPYVGVRVLTVGFEARELPKPLDGFGFLSGLEGVDLRLLGCVWTSSIFPDQAPSGKVLLRIIAGGAFDPKILDLSDEQALGEVLRDLDKSMGIKAAPTFHRQKRWPRAIPQYRLGHGALVDDLLAQTGRLTGLYLTGNAYKGLSLPDCIHQGELVAAQILP